MFMAVGTNRAMYSYDGITWTSSAISGTWRGVTWGNNMFVAVGTNSAMYSYDGITWNTINVEAYDWQDIVWGNNMFVAVADTENKNSIMFSYDGITWTSSEITGKWHGVTWGNNMFLAVANDAGGIIYAHDLSKINTIAIGNNAKAEFQNSIAIGYNAKATNRNQIMLGNSLCQVLTHTLCPIPYDTSIQMRSYQNNIGFYCGETLNGFIDICNQEQNLDFTGQHRTFIKNIPYSNAYMYEGLIVCADQNTNISISGKIKKGNSAINQNETLPLCSLSCKAYDKKCFGVISSSEDPNLRVDKIGSFSTPYQKEMGDTRIFINSLGEGAIWVCNQNGPLESGDYITTSDVYGYGMKQDSEHQSNYTVAKITMDCDFNPNYKPIPALSKYTNGQNILNDKGEIQWTNELENHIIVKDSNDNILYDEIHSQYTGNVIVSIPLKDISGTNIIDSSGVIKYMDSINIPIVNISGENILDEMGQLQYIDTITVPVFFKDIPLMSSNILLKNINDEYNQIQYVDTMNKNSDIIVDYLTMTSTRDIKYEYEYNIRYLNEYSEIISKEDYDMSGGFIAAYVGCTYHCG